MLHLRLRFSSRSLLQFLFACSAFHIIYLPLRILALVSHPPPQHQVQVMDGDGTEGEEEGTREDGTRGEENPNLDTEESGETKKI